VTTEHLPALEEVTSTKQACRLLGANRSTILRRRRPPLHGPPPPRPVPPNRLCDTERQRVLSVLRSEEYCDLAPAQVWAMLLDDGVYLCSIRTMYRILAAAGENRERRRQRTHPARTKPELIARNPNQVWSWDITKLAGPERGIYYELFVIIDIFSRYIVGWTVEAAETGERAESFIADAIDSQGVGRDQLTLHADRGSSMTSKPVSQLLVDLGVTRSHSRPSVSNDNPYSEAQFKTLKYCPAFPRRFGSIQDARSFCTAFFDHYNHVHRHHGIGLHTPGISPLRHRHRNPRCQSCHPRRRLQREPCPVPPPPTHTTQTPRGRLDQRPQPASTHRIRIDRCLIPLDTFRTSPRNCRGVVCHGTDRGGDGAASWCGGCTRSGCCVRDR
jgi:putative transposase